MRDDYITIALWLPEVQVVREEETGAEITVEVSYRAESAPCPRCGQWTPKVHCVRCQRKRDRSTAGGWDKPVFLVLHKRRFRCLGCRKVFSEPDLLFGARRRSSRRFREHLGQEALHQTVRHVAQRNPCDTDSETFGLGCLIDLCGRRRLALQPQFFDLGTACGPFSRLRKNSLPKCV